uniref:Uncharacterized protein n=1 Tax=Mus musculus TaxID=10090 RepID=Q3UTH4_MOUSE|nr:unnamed protein product [Mus musculus]
MSSPTGHLGGKQVKARAANPKDSFSDCRRSVLSPLECRRMQKVSFLLPTFGHYRSHLCPVSPLTLKTRSWRAESSIKENKAFLIYFLFLKLGKVGGSEK